MTGELTRKQLDDVEALRYAKRTHFTHFTVPALPWHSEAHKFGEATDGGRTGTEGCGGDDAEYVRPSTEPHGGDRQAQQTDTNRVALVDYGRCYYCGDPAVYGYRSRLYCGKCWIELEEFEES